MELNDAAFISQTRREPMKTILYLVLAAGIVFDVLSGAYLWNLTHAQEKGVEAGVRTGTASPRRVKERPVDRTSPAGPYYSRF